MTCPGCLSPVSSAIAPSVRSTVTRNGLYPNGCKGRRRMSITSPKTASVFPRKNRTSHCHRHDLIPYLLPDLVPLLPSALPRRDARHHRPGRLIVTVSECARQDIIRLFKTTPIRLSRSLRAQPLPAAAKGKCRLFLKRKYGILTLHSLCRRFEPRKNVAGLIWSYHKIRHCSPGTSNW